MINNFNQNILSMKTTLLSILLLLSAKYSFSQTVNNIPISELNTNFIEIVATQKLMSKKVTIQLDFGQQINSFGGMKQIVVQDKKGRNKEFNSVIDALNFFSQYGFKFEQSYCVTISNQNVYHYLMSKEESLQ